MFTNTKPSWSSAPLAASVIVMSKVAGVAVFAFAHRNQEGILVFTGDTSVAVNAPWRGVEDRPGTGDQERTRSEEASAGGPPPELVEALNELAQKLDVEVVVRNENTKEEFSINGDEDGKACGCEQCESGQVTLQEGLVFNHSKLGMVAVRSVSGKSAFVSFDFTTEAELNNDDCQDTIIDVVMDLADIDELTPEQAFKFDGTKPESRPGRAPLDMDDPATPEFIASALKDLAGIRDTKKDMPEGLRSLINHTIGLGESLLKKKNK